MLFDGAILFLALAGSVGQDRKKAKLMGERFHEWTAQTAFIPFSRGFANPGTIALVGGTVAVPPRDLAASVPRRDLALDRLTTRAAGAAALNRPQ